ncbi:MAG: hypothetical protein J2P35_14310 [Actinobacteria bacterium]|nr:hypothetical protein [Actinomycetota bacterium]
MTQGVSSGTAGGIPQQAGQRRSGIWAAFAGFVPWIAYWALIGSVTFRTAVVIAFALSLLAPGLAWLRGERPKVLELGGLAACPARSTGPCPAQGFGPPAILSVPGGRLTVMDTSPAHMPPPAAPGLPLATDHDVLARVGHLVDPGAVQSRSLWLFFLDRHGSQLPVAVPVDDLPEDADRQFAASLCAIIADVLAEHEPAGSAVLALARPGPSAPNEADLRWGRALADAARERGAAIRLLCLATPAQVRDLHPVTSPG